MTEKISNIALNAYREEFFKKAKSKPKTPHFYVQDVVNLRIDMESEKTYNRIFKEDNENGSSLVKRFNKLWKLSVK